MGATLLPPFKAHWPEAEPGSKIIRMRAQAPNTVFPYIPLTRSRC